MYNRLLERQLIRFIKNKEELPKVFLPLFQAISESYDHYERDHELTQRSLELSSEELKEKNDALKKVSAERERLFARLIKSYLSLQKKEGATEGLMGVRDKEIDEIANLLDRQISERDQLLIEVEKSRDNLLAFIENTIDEIWSIDSNLNLKNYNTKFKKNAFVVDKNKIHSGINLEELFDQEYRFRLIKLHERALKGEQFSVELSYDRGVERRYFELSFAPIISRGEVVGATVFSHDQTKRKEIEWAYVEAKELAEMGNRSKSEFLGNMSHELRTPLNTIIGYCEILQEEIGGQEGLSSAKGDIQKIQEAGSHLLSLIENVLEISNLEVSNAEIVLTTFDITALIEEAIAMVKPLIEKQRNALQVEIPHRGSLEMNSDLSKMRHILVNLLGNATKFTSEGIISLRLFTEVKAEEEWVHIEIQDTGRGITEEEKAFIFDLFTQADSSTTRQYEGSGLGLAISKRFCELLGGGIDVKSQVGVGSTFTVKVPRNYRSYPKTMRIE